MHVKRDAKTEPQYTNGLFVWTATPRLPNTLSRSVFYS